jgi:uncharacterized protein DUF1206
MAMATRTRTRRFASRAAARYTGRRTAASAFMSFLARAGFLARGIMYIVIGWIALEVAFHETHQAADRSGALHELGGTPFGAVALWVLVAGFFAMALWRLSEVAYGTPGTGRPNARTRLVAFVKAVFYALIAWSVLKYALGEGSPPSTDQQSVDLTATLMRHPGGRVAVIAAGVALIGGGLHLGYQAWRERFRDTMPLSQLRVWTRRVVEWLARVGGIARGIVFVTAGVFLLVAAARSQPGQAKGIDSALRTLAAAPIGPWLLVLVAIGLIMFGAFSCCEARWRRFERPLFETH